MHRDAPCYPAAVSLLLPIAQLLGGGLLLAGGGDLLVRGATRLATAAGVSSMVVGLTVVAFGTSMPELVTSVLARLAGSPEIAVSNVVGSNIANLLLVLPLGALIRALPLQSVTLRQDFPVLFAVTAAFALALYAGEPGRWTGGAFLLLLVAFTWFQVWSARRETAAVREQFAEAAPSVLAPAWRSAAFVLVGLALLVAGGKGVVDGAVSVARSIGLSERVIGLTIVAVGTSAPEIATTLMAVRRGEPDVAIGNAIGSNIFNLLGVAGVVLLLGPLPSSEGLLRLDLPVLLVATLASGVAWWRDRTLTRREAVVLLGGYVVYLCVLLT